MITPSILFLSIFISLAHQEIGALTLAQRFRETGYLEIADKNNGSTTFEALYTCFDELVEFLQTHPGWAQKLYTAKESFIRSPERNYYSTDFFGFYDESKREDRRQISFYYSIHLHEFVCSRYSEFKKIPEFMRLVGMCNEIQKPYENLFCQAASELGVETIFSSAYNRPPLLLKVIKYLPSYRAIKPHYDGTVFSLFLDSTDTSSLLLSPYKSSFTIDDFSPAIRKISRQDTQNSLLLIPGTLLEKFSLYPTPHIVTQSGKTRHATILFAMAPGYIPHQNALSPLPYFNH